MKKVELSLCNACHCMTWTVQKEGLSGSENKHYRYECGKCGFKKELEIIRAYADWKKRKAKKVKK